MEEDQFNSSFELYWAKVQNDLHKNLIQYGTFMKSYLVSNSLGILLKVKLSLKHVTYITYKTAIKYMGIKLGKSL